MRTFKPAPSARDGGPFNSDMVAFWPSFVGGELDGSGSDCSGDLCSVRRSSPRQEDALANIQTFARDPAPSSQQGGGRTTSPREGVAGPRRQPHLNQPPAGQFGRGLLPQKNESVSSRADVTWTHGVGEPSISGCGLAVIGGSSVSSSRVAIPNAARMLRAWWTDGCDAPGSRCSPW
jgi:hypothetical protein